MFFGSERTDARKLAVVTPSRSRNVRPHNDILIMRQESSAICKKWKNRQPRKSTSFSVDMTWVGPYHIYSCRNPTTMTEKSTAALSAGVGVMDAKMGRTDPFELYCTHSVRGYTRFLRHTDAGPYEAVDRLSNRFAESDQDKERYIHKHGICRSDVAKRDQARSYKSPIRNLTTTFPPFYAIPKSTSR